MILTVCLSSCLVAWFSHIQLKAQQLRSWRCTSLQPKNFCLCCCPESYISSWFQTILFWMKSRVRSSSSLTSLLVLTPYVKSSYINMTVFIQTFFFFGSVTETIHLGWRLLWIKWKFRQTADMLQFGWINRKACMSERCYYPLILTWLSTIKKPLKTTPIVLQLWQMLLELHTAVWAIANSHMDYYRSLCYRGACKEHMACQCL